MQKLSQKHGFTLAEVTMAKRVSDKTCSQEFVRMSEPKAPTNIFNKLCAFTLAEVLITLAIIGVVAALTIPTVVRNYTEKQTVVQVKKAYSQLSQALQMAQVEGGAIDTWNYKDDDIGKRAVKFLNIILPYLKITKNCGTGQGCWYSGWQKSLDGTARANVDTSTQYAKGQFANGVSFYLYLDSKCTVYASSKGSKDATCGAFDVDINGPKYPNVWGRDVFGFWITKVGLVPMGTQNDITFTLENECNISKKTYNNGLACTAWIMQKENMNYLKGAVSW